MENLDVSAVRRSVRLVHSVQKERALSCSIMMSAHGDIGPSTLDFDVSGGKQKPMSVRMFWQSKKKTDAAMKAMQKNEGSDPSNYESMLFLIRLILEDEDSLEELKEECTENEGSSVLLAPTFQSGLSQFNNMVKEILFADLFAVQLPSSGEQGNSNPLFDVSAVTRKIYGKSDDAFARNISQLFHRSFVALESFDSYTKFLFEKHINKSTSQLLGEDVKKQIDCLFTLLIALITLKESFHVELLFMQQFLSCESQHGENPKFFKKKKDCNQDFKCSIVSKLLCMLQEYQETIHKTIKKIVGCIDSCLYFEDQSNFSALFEDCLARNEDLSAFQTLYSDQGKKRHGAKKVLSLEMLIRLSMVHIEKLYKLELAVLEEIELCQLNPNDDNVPVRIRTRRRSSSSFKNPNNNTASQDGRRYSLGTFASENNFLQTLPPSDAKKMIETMTPDLLRCTLYSMLKVELDSSEFKGSGDDEDENEEDPSLPLDLIPVVNEWHVDINELKFKKKIGNGGAGTTYLSKWRREDVAVKVAMATGLGMSGWKKELRFLKNLHHPNVIRMLGCVFSEEPFTMLIILEFCDKGNLAKLLSRSTPRGFFTTASLGLANGLSYLHNKGIIHRDVKPDNILVHGNLDTGEFAVKIIDFGLSTFCDACKHSDTMELANGSHLETNDNCTSKAGTYRWMAPEIIRDEGYNFKCDVYSFAIVLWQLITREKPYADKEQEEAAELVAKGDNYRPPLPKGTPHEIKQLIETCWSELPCDRPEFDSVCEEIEKISTDMSKSDIHWLNASHGHQMYSKMKHSENKEEDPAQSNRLARRRSSGLRISLKSFGR